MRCLRGAGLARPPEASPWGEGASAPQGGLLNPVLDPRVISLVETAVVVRPATAAAGIAAPERSDHIAGVAGLGKDGRSAAALLGRAELPGHLVAEACIGVSRIAALAGAEGVASHFSQAVLL